MDDISRRITSRSDPSENRLKTFFSRLSTVREDSQEDEHQTKVQEQESVDSDFDIIELTNESNGLNEGILFCSLLDLIRIRTRREPFISKNEYLVPV